MHFQSTTGTPMSIALGARTSHGIRPYLSMVVHSRLLDLLPQGDDALLDLAEHLTGTLA